MTHHVKSRILSSLLKLTVASSRVSVAKLAELSASSRQVVERVLSELDEVSVSHGVAEVPSRERPFLALKSVEMGANQESIARLLSWKDFEDFAAAVLSRLDYEVLTRTRMTLGRKRMEIDVLAQRLRLIIVMDCKRWKSILTGKGLSRIVEQQASRAKRLGEALKRIYGSGKVSVSLMPVILCLHEPRLKFHNGWPILSIRKLHDFAMTLPTEVAGLRSHSINLSQVPDLAKLVSLHRTGVRPRPRLPRSHGRQAKLPEDF